MKDYLLVYRADTSAMPEASPEEKQSRTKSWMDWMGSIAAQNKLKDGGNRLNTNGKVVGANGVITDGPYSEIKESILGYSLVSAGSYEEAVELTKGCPILRVGTVEVREIDPM